MSKRWKISLYIVIPIIAVAIIVLSYIFYNQNHIDYNSGGDNDSWETPLPSNSSFDHTKNFSFGQDLNYYLGDEINLLPIDTNYIYSYTIEDTSILESTNYGKIEAKSCGETKVSISYNNTQVYVANISINVSIVFNQSEKMIVENNSIYLKKNNQPFSFKFINSSGEVMVHDGTIISSDKAIKISNKASKSFLSVTGDGQLYIDNDEYNIHLVYNVIRDF